jgi:hypothetical protein
MGRAAARKVSGKSPGAISGNALFEAAIAYAKLGWSVIPTRGKCAAGGWLAFQQRRANATTLKRMFARASVTGLAVITGSVSGGLAVRDFDQAESYDRWAAADPDNASRLPTVRTARGFHVYGRLDEENYADLGDGELRADSGHYVLLPPSAHPDGMVYAWTIALPPPGTPLPALPLSLTHARTQSLHPLHTTPTHPAHPAIPLHGLHRLQCDSEINSVIAELQPTGPGQRNRLLFDLARELKGKCPNATSEELRAIVRHWHQQALPVIRTKSFDESWTDFVIAWQRVQRPAGQSFAAAAKAAEVCTVPAAAKYDGHLHRLVCLCWQLAQQWGNSPFPLGCEIAAEYLGVSGVHASRLLNTLRFEGVLTRVTKGCKRTKKASEWRFVDLVNDDRP